MKDGTATTPPTGSGGGAPKDTRFSVGSLSYTKAGLVILFGWLLWGDFCFTLFESIGGPGILGLYLQDNFHVSNMQINIIFNVIPQLIGVIVGPILSFKSDRYRGRFGRRIPFLMWTTPFLCIFAAAIGYSDEIVAYCKSSIAAGGFFSPFTVAMLLISFLVIGFSFFNEFVNTVYWYLFADVVPEHFMGRFLGLFRLVGALAGFLINILIAAHQLTHMRMIHIGVATLYFVGFTLMCFFVKEGKYPDVTDVTKKTTFMEQVRIYMRECFSHPIYIVLYLGTFVWVLARAAGAAGIFGLHISQHVAMTGAHAGVAQSVAMTPSGSAIITAGADGGVRLWNPPAGTKRKKEVPSGRVLIENGPAATSSALAPDGKTAIAGFKDGRIGMWQTAGDQACTNFAAHQGAVLSLAVSRDGTRLASGGADNAVKLWDLQSGQCLRTLSGFTGEVRCVAFSSDGGRLAAGGMDGKILVHDTADGKLVSTVSSNIGPVYALTFAPSLEKGARQAKSGATFGVAPFDWVISYIKDVFSNESLYDLPVDQRSRVVAQDAWLISGGQDDGADSRNAQVRVWDARNGQFVMALKGHKLAITSVQYKPDLHMLLSGSLDSTLRMWDPADISPLAGDQSLKTFSGYTRDVTALAVPEEGKLVANTSVEGKLHVWNIDEGVSLRKFGIMASFFGIIGLLLAYPTGALVDRYHAVRITLVGSFALIPIPFIAYFITYDYMSMVWLEVFKVPLFSVVGAAGIPLLIAIFPKDKFGQMCSANGLIKQGSQLVLGCFGAWFLDWVTQKTLLTDNFRYAYLWMGVGFVLYQWTLWILYRQWKNLGGDGKYRAPGSAEELAQTEAGETAKA